MGDERGLGAHARSGRGGLATGVTAAHDNDVVVHVRPSSAELLAEWAGIVYFGAAQGSTFHVKPAQSENRALAHSPHARPLAVRCIGAGENKHSAAGAVGH
jgi:hypothetical protein